MAPVHPSLNPGAFAASALPPNPGLGLSQTFPAPTGSPYFPESEPSRSGPTAPYYFETPSIASSPRMFESPAPESGHLSNPLNYTTAHTYPGINANLVADEWLPMDLRGSKSPMSASSSIPQHWQPSQAFHHLHSAFSPSGSEISGLSNYDTPTLRSTSAGVIDPVSRDASRDATSLPTYFAEQDRIEHIQISRGLATLNDLPKDDDGMVAFGSFEGRYLDAYWQNFQPLFSIMHRPSFDSFSVSPLVRALMVTIGAQYFDDDEAQGVARCLREICTKLLQRASTYDCNPNERVINPLAETEY